MTFKTKTCKRKEVKIEHQIQMKWLCKRTRTSHTFAVTCTIPKIHSIRDVSWVSSDILDVFTAEKYVKYTQLIDDRIKFISYTLRVRAFMFPCIEISYSTEAEKMLWPLFTTKKYWKKGKKVENRLCTSFTVISCVLCVCTVCVTFGVSARVRTRALFAIHSHRQQCFSKCVCTTTVQIIFFIAFPCNSHILYFNLRTTFLVRLFLPFFPSFVCSAGWLAGWLDVVFFPSFVEQHKKLIIAHNGIYTIFISIILIA